MSGSIITTSSIAKRFNSTDALVDVNLDVEPGVIGLIGPNGAGKTTLLRVLLGLIKSDKGRACIFGLDVFKQSFQIRKKIGVLHEKPVYPPFMKVDQYLGMVTKLYRSKKSPRDLLKLVGLADVGQRQIRNLSAGMNQRLGIAQSLAGEPELVFLDEPTSNLDVNGRDEIIKLVIELNNDFGTSFFISSHILSELERLCHTIAIMNTGRILESGPTKKLIEKYTFEHYRVSSSNLTVLTSIVRNIQGAVVLGTTGIDEITFSIKNVDILTSN
jgi:ABC-2 type transport system ATP-binding protein